MDVSGGSKKTWILVDFINNGGYQWRDHGREKMKNSDVEFLSGGITTAFLFA